MSECTRCGKINVETRTSESTGRDYLANVEPYPSGRSYFRGLHTREQCDGILAARDADRAAWAARDAEKAAERENAAAREAVAEAMADEVAQWHQAGVDLVLAGGDAEALSAHLAQNPAHLECIRLGLMEVRA